MPLLSETCGRLKKLSAYHTARPLRLFEPGLHDMVQVASGWSQEEFPVAAEAARSEGVDPVTLDQIAAVRGIQANSAAQ